MVDVSGSRARGLRAIAETGDSTPITTTSTLGDYVNVHVHDDVYVYVYE
jgi:hypothetical protein